MAQPACIDPPLDDHRRVRPRHGQFVVMADKIGIVEAWRTGRDRPQDKVVAFAALPRGRSSQRNGLVISAKLAHQARFDRHVPFDLPSEDIVPSYRATPCMEPAIDGAPLRIGRAPSHQPCAGFAQNRIHAEEIVGRVPAVVVGKDHHIAARQPQPRVARRARAGCIHQSQMPHRERPAIRCEQGRKVDCAVLVHHDHLERAQMLRRQAFEQAQQRSFPVHGGHDQAETHRNRVCSSLERRVDHAPFIAAPARSATARNVIKPFWPIGGTGHMGEATLLETARELMAQTLAALPAAPHSAASVAATRPAGGPSDEASALPRLVINGRFMVQEVTGVQRVACELTRQIEAMLESGALVADVTLLVPRGKWVQSLALKRIKVRTVGVLKGFWWEQFELPRHLRGATLLCLGNSAPALTLLGRSTPVAVMIHDVSYLDHPGAYRLGYRVGHRLMLPLLLKGARRIFTVSQTERERLIAIDPRVAPRIMVTPNGGWSDAGQAASVDIPPLVPGYALYVGSLSHRKNFGRILAAAVRLAREDGMEFVFVGSTGRILRMPGRDVPEDVAGRIHFLGQVNDRERLGRIYADAGVLVFPSLYEASPLPPLEAAHFGCPVVASNIPSMWERCGTSVSYCDPRSLDSIVAAVRRVMSDPEARARAVAAGHRNAAARSWFAQAEAICREILPVSCLPAPRERLRAIATSGARG